MYVKVRCQWVKAGGYIGDGEEQERSQGGHNATWTVLYYVFPVYCITTYECWLSQRLCYSLLQMSACHCCCSLCATTDQQVGTPGTSISSGWGS